MILLFTLKTTSHLHERIDGGENGRMCCVA
jgi:hypothetical protein